MNYDQVLKYFVTQEKAAGAVGLSQPRMAHWKANGIPLPIQCQFELVTRGALKVDRRELKAAMK